MGEADVTTSELKRLYRMEAEYKVTLQALAVVCERLLIATESGAVEIDQAALHESPDLSSWRDPQSGHIVITVSR